MYVYTQYTVYKSKCTTLVCITLLIIIYIDLETMLGSYCLPYNLIIKWQYDLMFTICLVLSRSIIALFLSCSKYGSNYF